MCSARVTLTTRLLLSVFQIPVQMVGAVNNLLLDPQSGEKMMRSVLF